MTPDPVPPSDDSAVEAAYARLDSLTIGQARTQSPMDLITHLWAGWRLVAQSDPVGPSLVVLAEHPDGRWATTRFDVRSSFSLDAAMSLERIKELADRPLAETWAEVPLRTRLDIIFESRDREGNHHVCGDFPALLHRVAALVVEFDLGEEFALAVAEFRRLPEAEQDAVQSLLGLSGVNLGALVNERGTDRHRVFHLD